MNRANIVYSGEKSPENLILTSRRMKKPALLPALGVVI